MPPTLVTRSAVLAWMSDAAFIVGRHYVLVDLRRTDFVGGSIRGSINLPAQTLETTLPTMYNLFKAAGVEKVVWYCMSSRGRGIRAADLFSDYLEAKGDTMIESLILTEGIRGWANAGDNFTAWMDGYEASFWATEEKRPETSAVA